MQDHLPTSICTAKGHIKQERSNLQSTKTSSPPQAGLDDVAKKNLIDDLFPVSDIPNVKTNEVVLSIHEYKDVGYMDLTGRFPKRSVRGNEYILACYHYDANAILVQPLKNCQAQIITDAWELISHRLCIAGAQPKKLF